MRWSWILFSFLAVACGASPSSGESQDNAEFQEILNATKVIFQDACIINDDLVRLPPETSDQDPEELAPVLAAFLTSVGPSLVEAATGFVVNWLKNRSNEYSTTVTTEGNARLVMPGQWKEPGKAGIGCLIIVGGEFANEPTVGRPALIPEPWNPTKLDALDLRLPPSFYLELWMTQFGPTHVKLEPKYFFYSKPYAKRTSKKYEKDLLITATFNVQVPGKNKALEDKPLLSYAYFLPDTKIPSRLAKGPLSNLGTKVLIPAVGPSSTPANGMQPPLPVGNVNQASSVEIISNIQVTILETEDGGDLLLALSNFVEEKKTSIDKTLVEQLKVLLEEDK